MTAFAFNPQDSGVAWTYAEKPDLGLLFSRDEGATWEPVGVNLGPDDWINYIAVNPEVPGELYLATESLDVYRSSNGGRSMTVMMRAGQAVQ